MIKLKNFFRKILFVVVVFSITLITGCKAGEPSQPFDEFIDQMYVEMLAGNPLNINFFLKDPSVYGLEDVEVTPITISNLSHKQSMWQLKSLKEYLQRYNYANLTDEQKLTYDIFLDYINNLLSQSDFYYYDTPLGSYNGYQAQLPFILAEYHFYTKRDIENYFAYLTTTQKTFENIIKFEKEKVSEGFGMSDHIINGIIEQCNNFLSEQENFLIPIFNTKINELTYLTTEEKTNYKAQNLTYVNNDFKNAYIYLKGELEKLKGQAKNNMGLSNFKNGKAYYETLFKQATGTNMTVTAGLNYLKARLQEDIDQLRNYMGKYPNLMNDISNPNLIASKTYQETLQFYLEKYKLDFPTIGDVNVTFKPIHASLEENSSPAMYFISPIDANVPEIIYVNNTLFTENPTYAFITLAHEGVPGHLLQHVYLKNMNIPNLRKFIDFNSYSEGWATYVEEYIGKYLGVNPEIMDAYYINHRITYIILSIADIEINYNSMNLTDFNRYITDYFGNIEQSAVEDMYYQLIEEPTNFFEYYFSYYQIMDLKDEFKLKAVNKGYSNIDYEFHKFMLETGPSPFYILTSQMDIYLSKN